MAADKNIIVSITDYVVEQNDCRLGPLDLSIAAGEFLVIDTEFPEHASFLLRTLATLVRPLQGTYRFMGTPLRFSNYQDILEYKKRIGYLSAGIGMISNRTIMSNLLLPRYYAENSLSLALAPETENLCERFGLTGRLLRQVTDATNWDLRTATIIRELMKHPDLLLVERPEEMVPPGTRTVLVDILQQAIADGKPVILFSRDRKFLERLSPTGRVEITGGMCCKNCPDRL
ncbi:MAG: hypothetical protein SWH61_02950 [Thermodesulfobacteriota bacterium]|nr:hypothetical protein [Thermodesulfobacteriota bacterium]